MKTVFITSRGGTHPIHRAYAESIEADFQYIDFTLPWHGVQASRAKKYLSWVICALTFPNRKKYDMFLVSGQHVMPILMKLFRRLEKRQKLICFHANEGLYFTHSKKYGKINRWLMKKILPLYDAHICVGKMQADLLQKVTNHQTKRIFTIENGVKNKLHKTLSYVKPNLESRQILSIGNLYSGWRSWYKGIDLMIDAVLIVSKNYPDVELQIVGNYADDYKKEFDAKLYPHNIQLSGPSNNIISFLSSSGLYLHCGRGDAFPTTTIEALAAGLPCIVSHFTGTKQIVSEVDPSLIVNLDPAEIADRIIAYFSLSLNEKTRLSTKGREISKEYILEEKIEFFKETISTIFEL